jgi:hypothetical protein
LRDDHLHGHRRRRRRFRRRCQVVSDGEGTWLEVYDIEVPAP